MIIKINDDRSYKAFLRNYNHDREYSCYDYGIILNEIKYCTFGEIVFLPLGFGIDIGEDDEIKEFVISFYDIGKKFKCDIEFCGFITAHQKEIIIKSVSKDLDNYLNDHFLSQIKNEAIQDLKSKTKQNIKIELELIERKKQQLQELNNRI